MHKQTLASLAQEKHDLSAATEMQRKGRSKANKHIIGMANGLMIVEEGLQFYTNRSIIRSDSGGAATRPAGFRI
jgi:uncharacterized phage protein gp47/JayE